VKQKILIVDDEPDVIDLVKYNLAQAGYEVATASEGFEGFRKAQDLHPSLILLDVMMPGMDGLEVCKRLRADPKTARIPVIMLTAKASEVDRVLGLELGADDYVTKPFSPRELILRIKKLLQRAHVAESASETHQIGDLSVDMPRHRVTIKGRVIHLTATEFKLLVTLIERKGHVQTREKLLRDVWEYDKGIDTRTVDTHMRRLREKLGTFGTKYLDTVRGVGYRFVES
jgi:two-component system phosphate regulon response regulator PhoB